ncbi:MAG: DUF4298 domain-containing protein [Bacteroidaceae bacterium]|nr:DUF4298 domain-containing protein [Bacteroidaceae bacterium]
MKRIERISSHEARFGRIAQAIKQLSQALESWDDVQADIDQLQAYYGSRWWHADRDADAAGRLPKDMPRGVLSEDGIWNLLEDIRNLQEMMSPAMRIRSGRSQSITSTHRASTSNTTKSKGTLLGAEDPTS